MSGRVALIFTAIEKIIGLVMIAIGAALTYYTYTSLSAAGASAVFFIGSGLILIVVGIFLVIAKTT